MATQSSSTRSDFYVYALFRANGVPFYIGKGRGRRWMRSAQEAGRTAKSHKSHIIRGIRADGAEIIKVKLHEGLTEAVAHEYEVALIKAIGRGANGPLVNITDGGEGFTGAKHTLESRATIKATWLLLAADPVWLEAIAAKNRQMAADPAWLEAVTVKNKQLATDPKFVEAIAIRTADSRWREKNAAGKISMNTKNIAESNRRRSTDPIWLANVTRANRLRAATEREAKARRG